MKFCVIWAFFSTAMIVSGISFADTETARSEFAAAKKQFADGQFEAAALSFRRAYDADPNWKLLYNIGQCESAAKHYGIAVEAFESYLAMGGDEVNESRRDEVEQEIDGLKRLVGYVNLESPDGATVMIAGVTRGTTPLPGALAVTAAVPQEIIVTKDDTVLLKRQMKVGGGQTITVQVGQEETAPIAQASTTSASSTTTYAPLPSDDPNTANQPRTEIGRSPLVPTGIALMATGGAAIIGGAIVGGMAMGLNTDLTENCPGGECAPEYHADHKKLNTLAVTSTVLFIAGGVVAATGVALFIVGKKQGKTEKQIAVLPLLATDFAGLSMQGSF